MTATARADAAPAALDATARRFILLLIAVTAAPMAFCLLLSGWIGTSRIASDTYRLLIFLAIAHVPLTTFFWADRRYRVHMNGRPGLYYVVPLAIVGACSAVPFAFGAAGVEYLLLVYFAWLLWHYGRQNWGLLCLTAAGTKTPAPSLLERRILLAAPLAGILGALPTLPAAKASVLVPWLDAAYWTGAAVMAGVAVAWLAVLARQLVGKVETARVVMTALLSLFYLPTFLSADFGVMAYATAHAAQYFVMMYALAADRKQGATVARLLTLTLAAIVGYWLATSLNEIAVWGAAVGTGITMSHFFIDSRVWRLREPFQRGAIRESFGFLFR